MKSLRILTILVAGALLLTGCSAPQEGVALQQCVNGLADAGDLPMADDVNLDLRVAPEGSAFSVTGFAHVTTTDGVAESYQIACVVEPDGTLTDAASDRVK